MSTSPYRSGSVVRMVLGVFVWPQTYVNVLYLLLAFPLGIAYFVILVTGFSVGVGTLIIWVGVPILLLVFLVSWALTMFERELTVLLLKEDIPPIRRHRQPEANDGARGLGLEERLFIGVWRRLKSHFSNPVTWTGVVYLLARFPIGVASFVVTVVMLSVTFGFIGTPIYYRWSETNIGPWEIDTAGEALVFVPIGLLLLLVTPHVLNLAAFLSGRFAHLMLGAAQLRPEGAGPAD